MRPVRVRELQDLLRPRKGPCVSIYLPTHRYRPENDQDRIRYRNLVHQAGSLLRSRYSEQEARRFLRPLEALSEHAFWLHQKDGLAVFRSNDETLHYLLPMTLPELVVISDTFHTLPLVKFLYLDRRYYVLALARKAVTLYEGSPEALAEVEVEGLPSDVKSALGEELIEQSLGYHSPTGRAGKPIYHGQPVRSDVKDTVLRYFRAIDKALWGFLHEERAPLVLAGVGYYHPIYRQVNRYPFLLHQGVEGNVEREDLEELHRKSWELVSARFAAEAREAVNAFGAALPRGRASDEIPEAAQAAVQGRVRWLLCAAGRHVWGRLDRTSGTVEIAARQRGVDDADLLDELGEVTIARGGDVLEIAPAEMPTRSPVAAVFRY